MNLRASSFVALLDRDGLPGVSNLDAPYFFIAGLLLESSVVKREV